MRIPSTQRRQSGLSLIEVLIAVVVLATGLLAMAALQGKLAGSSADAKSRSRVAALLTSTIDYERSLGYSSVVAFSNTTCTGTLLALPLVPAAICSAQNDAGISGLGLVQTVATFYGLSGGGAFTGSTPALGADYVEYKRILLKATWTDAVGQTREIGATNVVSVLGLSSATTLLDKSLITNAVSPIVHQPNPALTAGVIPIAVGDNKDAASTNPQPTLAQTLPSTSFNTLTYTQGANDSSTTRTIQQRVETTVAECLCQLAITNPFVDKFGNLDLFLGSTSFRPTFWDGTKYTPPKDALITPYSSQQVDLIGSQDDRCSVVCRDHHDASTNTVKYDSVTGDLNRYQATVTTTKVKGVSTTTVALKVDGSNNPIPTAGSTDVYLDAARLIRVDGLWRVATDMHSAHLGLLATTPKGIATSPTPDSSSEALYENFVIGFLGLKLNEVLNGGAKPDANAVYASYNLNEPDTVEALTTSGSYKYLHGRGLYFDTLEQEALDKLDSVNADCGSADFPKCLLPYLPFNTINVTQLAKWKALSDAPQTTNGKISVTNSTTSNTATLCNGTTQIRGCVSGVSASSGTTNLDEANATMGTSNSAVASSTEISPYELDSANILADSQPFTVTGTSTASEFFAVLAGEITTLDSTVLSFWTDDLSTNNEPTVQWNIAGAFGFCLGSFARADTNPNPYDCVTSVSLLTPMTVTVGNYNQVVEQSVSNPCTGGTGTYKQPTLVCYAVDTTPSAISVTGVSGYTASVTSTSGTTKATSEQTLITIDSVPSSVIPASQATLNLQFINNFTAAGTYACDATTHVPTYSVPTACN